jgi:hypothetical protein
MEVRQPSAGLAPRMAVFVWGKQRTGSFPSRRKEPGGSGLLFTVWFDSPTC